MTSILIPSTIPTPLITILDNHLSIPTQDNHPLYLPSIQLLKGAALLANSRCNSSTDIINHPSSHPSLPPPYINNHPSLPSIQLLKGAALLANSKCSSSTDIIIHRSSHPSLPHSLLQTARFAHAVRSLTTSLMGK